MAAKDHLELCRWASERARKAGATQARVGVQRQHYSSLRYRERRVETLEESTVKGLNLSLYIDGKYSTHRTSDLRRDALGTFIEESVAMTRHLTRDQFRSLLTPSTTRGASRSISI